MDNPAATTKFMATGLDGTRRDASTSVGAPCQEEDGTWSCSVEFSGTGKFDGVHKLFGGDSLQALCMAMQFMRMALEHLNATRKLSYPGQGEEDVRWPLEAYFPSAPHGHE